MERLWTGQLKVSLEHQVNDSSGKQLSVMSVNSGPSKARSDGAQINSDSQRQGGSNETLNVNVDFLGDPRSS